MRKKDYPMDSKELSGIGVGLSNEVKSYLMSYLMKSEKICPMSYLTWKKVF